MQTSIHINLEKKTPDGWITAENWITKIKDGKKIYYKGDFDGFIPILNSRPAMVDFFFDTDYRGVKSIGPLKGFPEDASLEVKSAYEYWGSDAHSPSWATVEELRNFDFNHVNRCKGYVRIYDYKYLDRRPPIFAVTPGNDYKAISREEMDELIKAGELDDSGFCTWMEWNQTHSDLFPWLKNDIDKMEDNTRLVYWLDN